MNVTDILEKIFNKEYNIDKEANFSYEFMNEMFGSHLWIPNETWEQYVKTVTVNQWLDTDTNVGVHFHFLNGIYMCYTAQYSRKDSVRFFWDSIQRYVDAYRDLSHFLIADDMVPCTVVDRETPIFERYFDSYGTSWHS